ncbi:hypothetical protein COCON_G00125410 [Conger conger]|uniref:Peptide-N(4)-(N-acetyl-beta-glucosaminyl)asparagine amidase n=1 Tax=Conger conger TaxID=82655 RepID=A0A9Q1HWX8_CONCO|nr:hypothetical protein COCON_G00125410 [Conger conger]
MVYESPSLQHKALELIPLPRLTATAQSRLKQAQEADPGCGLSEQDMLLLELLGWFKGQFFSWVNCLPCVRCGGPTQSRGGLPPPQTSCAGTQGGWRTTTAPPARTPPASPGLSSCRYNNPEKLLETRRGRCGEWANCFTLCCRAVGLDARYIWDSTDHVWTEVYSESQRRWLHCDPCGLRSITARSEHSVPVQVVDVTWRYSCKHEEVLTRRTQVQEPWLRETINTLNSARQQSLSVERRKELLGRLLVELVEFISPKKPKPGELGGRISGSLAWRAARGETCPATKPEEFVFIPTDMEKSEGRFHLQYSASADRYLRVCSGQEEMAGWESGAWRREGVFRKEEQDWNMRAPMRLQQSGKISWRFDCGPAGLRMRTVKVRATGQTFQSGSVCWRMCSGQDTIEFPGDGEMHVAQRMAGCTELVVEAELSGGEGECSWQHAQLFRQSLQDPQEPSLEILIQLEEA